MCSLALLAEWEEYLFANDRAGSTVDAYLQGVWRLATFVRRNRGKTHLLDVDRGDATAWLASMPRTPYKRQYLKGAVSLYSFCIASGYLLDDPFGLAKPPRIHRQPPEAFSGEEVTRLLIAASAHDERRGWAILACLGLGGRRTEFVSLRLQDVDFDKSLVHFRVNVKNDTPRDVPMSEWARDGLSALVEVMDSWPSSDGTRILPIEPNVFTQWVNKAAVDCGFPPGRKRRAHTLRATAITMMLNDGVPVHVVASVVGHRNLSTTSAYAAVVDKQRMEAVSVLG